MISLSNSSDKAIRAQVAESISLVAKSDFPENWPDLVDVSSLLLTRLVCRTLTHGIPGTHRN